MDFEKGSPGLAVHVERLPCRDDQTGTDDPQGLGKVLLAVEPHPDEKPVTDWLNASDPVNENILHPVGFLELEQPSHGRTPIVVEASF